LIGKMPNSIEKAKQILKAAALSEEKSVKWDLGKRWDCMNSIEKLKQKLNKMRVHSVLIMLVAENPKNHLPEKFVLQEALMIVATTCQLEKHLLI